MEGEKVVELAEAHIGEDYILGAVANYNNAKWKGPWDCAEFATWCVYQAYGVLYGCDAKGSPGSAYTGEWKAQSASKGERISVDEAVRTPGAFILRYPGSGGIKIGHIVISAGDGSTIEAKDKASGVVRGVTAGRRWDTGVLIPGVDYSRPSDTALAGLILKFEALPQYSAKVQALQDALQDRGFDPGPTDGLFGEQTEAAVASFQAAHGLVSDGEAGPQTLSELGLLDPEAEAEKGTTGVIQSEVKQLSAPKVPIKSSKFEELEKEYQLLFESAVLRPDKQTMIEQAAQRVLDGRERYEIVAGKVGAIPWFVVGVIHDLESTSNFKTHLHNGDPLKAKTVNVPKGHPAKGSPPFKWEDSAIDALTLKDFHLANDWGTARTLYRLEAYNGFGTRKKGVFTPYLWSGSMHYTSGKYVKDFVWDASAVSKQIGAGVILRVLVDKGDIAFADS